MQERQEYFFQRLQLPGRETWFSIMLFLLLSSGVLFGEAPGIFADQLFGDGDYTRAIGEYKRLSFFCADPGSSLYFQYKIGECYRFLGNYERAKEWYDNVLLEIDSDEELKRRAVVSSAICLINRDDTQYARIMLQDFLAHGSRHDSLHYLMGVCYLREHRLIEADDAFAGIQAPELRRTADVLLDGVSARKLKSPKTALILSAFLPGAGQIYAGRSVKGIISFSLNFSLGYLTYKAFKDDRKLDGFLIIYFGLQRFYFGNLAQARRYAADYNQRVRENINVE